MQAHSHTNDTIVAVPEPEAPASTRTYREIQAAVAAEDLIRNSTPFLTWLAGWHTSLPTVNLDDVVRDPNKVALVSADMINGFCVEGPLASARVGALIEPIVALMQDLHDAGVTRWVLAQEWHEPDAPEFDQYGVHCVRGTREAETVDEMKNLPFADEFVIVNKNSLNAAIETSFDSWLDQPENAELDTFVAVGDCTDLCTYQLAMHVKLRGNAQNRKVRVVVPENCVQTFDIPVETAQQLGIKPHDGDLLHLIFLYHMALNGCEVVKRVVAGAQR